MRQAVAVPYARGDWATLSGALEQLPAFNPAPRDVAWQSWNRYAHTAAAAARRERGRDVVRSCAGCHIKYRGAYVTAHRDRPLEPTERTR